MPLSPYLPSHPSPRSPYLHSHFYSTLVALHDIILPPLSLPNPPLPATTLVALQDITEDMGPTLFLPDTHTKAMHKKFDGSKSKGR